MTGSTHPLMLGEVQFITNEMIRVLRLCFDRVISRRPAVMFEGSSRVGKSMCAEFVQAQLAPKIPNAHVTLCIARDRHDHRWNVLRELCHAENTATKQKIDILYHLVNLIASQLADSVNKQYVLIIDEIQNFNSVDYKILVDLHNCLKQVNISLTVIGFSQPNIYEKRSGFQEVKERRIVSRFLSEIHTYHGCQSSADLTAILHACDEGSEFPVLSGLSYTEYFLPKAFGSGFRLATLSGLFWKFLSDSVAGEYTNNLPMEHFCESLKNYLKFAAHNDTDLFEVNEEDVRKAVEASNLRVFCDVA
ncbi:MULTISPECIES: ATP-binding protein [unclassified Pseudomonas]|uniref:ATP-binding protein n=1 Tax=unclassified Pseudomonas TaxID=196821 RepID=UPI001CBB2C93|nr:MULTISPECIES: ATP-binding protein [unclassified Pseudomonas]